MTDLPSAAPVDDQLLHEAATWFARMRGPDAEGSRAEFEGWLARGAPHRRAYNRAAEIFAMGKLLVPENDGSVEPPARQNRVRRPVAMLASVALLIAVGAGSFALRPLWRSTAPGGDMVDYSSGADAGRHLYATGSTESRSARLSDGSTVRLAAESTLAVIYSAGARRLELERGAARFEVAHEERPFVVEAGGGSITARGTIFDVALVSGRTVSVDLIRGKVDVVLPVPPNARQGKPFVHRLRAGETIKFDAVDQQSFPVRNPAGKSVSATDIRALGGAVVPVRNFDNIRLADLIAEANRNATQPIMLESPGLGERRISGRFRIDDPAVLADRLSALFNFTVERHESGILLK